MIDLVGQTDAHQRTARTLWAVFQRRRDGATLCHVPQPLDCALRGGDQIVVERDAHPFAAGNEVQHSFVALVAVLAQDQALHAQLYPFRVVGALLHVRPFATFVVDRHHLSLIRLDQVHARDQPQALG